jgi:putative ABC transport system permease protein
MALGARGSLISGLVLKQSIVLVLIGIALGMGFALALTRFISSLLFDVSATDPARLAAVSVFMGLDCGGGELHPGAKSDQSRSDDRAAM